MSRNAFLIVIVSTGTLAAADSAPVTFHKDILPILQKNCQTCHRPGEAAPMSFLTYKDVRPWAKDMKAALATRKMPPWFADPQFGHFLNDRSPYWDDKPRDNEGSALPDRLNGSQVPTGFKEDTWITSVQIRPEHREVTITCAWGSIMPPSWFAPAAISPSTCTTPPMGLPLPITF
jgi:hypothetical protein